MHTFADPLRRALCVAPDSTAIIFDDRRFTYRELWSRCCRLASVLQQAGAVPGDRVAILAANSAQYRPRAGRTAATGRYGHHDAGRV